MQKYVVFLVLALLAAGAAAARAEDVIELGASMPLSGKYATDGKSTLEGYELAVDRINEKGGVKVGSKTYRLKLVEVDDASDAEKAAEETRRLIEKQGIKFMLGSYATPLIKAQIPIVEKLKVPYVQGGGGAKSLFSSDHKYSFGILNTAEQYFSPAIGLIVDKARAEGKEPSSLTLAVAVEPEPFSRGVAAGVVADAAAAGIKTVVNEELPKDLNDMTAFLEKAKAAKPTILMVSGHSKGAKLLAAELPKSGLKVAVVGVTHCDGARLTENSAAVAEGFLCPSQWDPTIPFRDRWFDSAAGFQKSYEARFRHSAAYTAAQGGAVIEVFAAAFEKAGSLEPEKVRAAIADTNLKTFYGAVRFDETGLNTGKTMVMYQIQHGQYKVVAPMQWKQADLVSKL